MSSFIISSTIKHISHGYYYKKYEPCNLKKIKKYSRQVHEEPPKHATPVCGAIHDTLQQVTRALEPSRNPESRELLLLLRSRHLRSLLETHDAVVAVKQNESSISERRERRSFRSSSMPSNDVMMSMEAVRIVGLRRLPDEPLVGISYICHIFFFMSI